VWRLIRLRFAIEMNREEAHEFSLDFSHCKLYSMGLQGHLPASYLRHNHSRCENAASKVSGSLADLRKGLCFGIQVSLPEASQDAKVGP